MVPKIKMRGGLDELSKAFGNVGYDPKTSKVELN